MGKRPSTPPSRPGTKGKKKKKTFLKRYFSTLLSCLLIAGLVSAGLLLPGQLLRREEKKLLGDATTVPAAEVSPYENSSAALTDRMIKDAALLEASLYYGDSDLILDREPIAGELSLEEAEEHALQFLSALSGSYETSDYLMDSASFYTSLQDSQTSIWMLYFYNGPMDAHYACALDGVTGIPLWTAFYGLISDVKPTDFAPIVNYYASCGLEFTSVDDYLIFSPIAAGWFYEDAESFGYSPEGDYFTYSAWNKDLMLSQELLDAGEVRYGYLALTATPWSTSTDVYDSSTGKEAAAAVENGSLDTIG